MWNMSKLASPTFINNKVNEIFSKRWLIYPLILLGIFWMIIWLVLGNESGACGKAGCASDHLITLGSFPTLLLALKLDLIGGATNMGKLVLLDSLIASFNIFVLGAILGKIVDKIKK